MARIRILVAEDHPVYRDGLRSVLESDPDVEWVGEATTGEEALRRAAELKPDVILLDIGLPEMNGLVVTRRLRSRGSKVRILILTGDSDSTLKSEAVAAGADGFLLKHNNREVILRAVQAVASGLSVFEKGGSTGSSGGPRKPVPALPHDLFPELSLLKRETLTLMAEGLTNHEIADIRQCKLKTVQNIIVDIQNVLGVKGREQLIREVAQRKAMRMPTGTGDSE